VLVRVSEEGRSLIDQLVTSWRTLSASLLENLDGEELAKVHEALSLLLKAARQNREA
jgi:DNA-binding MarR family transcriptional regulator